MDKNEGQSGVSRVSQVGEDAVGSVQNNIISLKRFTNGQSLSPIRQAEAYWNALREHNGLPKRADVDPRGLSNILHQTFVLERVATRVARFRLAGRGVSTVSGMEVRGMPLSALFTPSGRDQISSVVTELFDMPAVVEMSLYCPSRFRQTAFESQMILLPLLDDEGRVSRALGALVTDSDVNVSSARFDITGKFTRIVSGLSYRDTESDLLSNETQSNPARPDTAKSTGFAEEKLLFSTKAPHLKLVRTRD